MVEITLPILLQIVQTMALLVGIVYYITIMRNQQKAQQESEKSRRNELVYGKLQNISLEYATSFNEVMTFRDWKDPEEWEEKYGRNNNLAAFSKWNYVMRHYQLAGLLLKQGADPEIIFELYPCGAVINLYELFQPIIEHKKKVESWDFTNLDYLYYEAKKMWREKKTDSNVND
jgi:hypothetical protein